MTVRDELVEELSVLCDLAVEVEGLRGVDSRFADFLRDHGPALVEALRDAERYRWLRDKAHEEWRVTSIGIYQNWGGDLGSIGGMDAEAEIDLAMDGDALRGES